MSNKKVIKAGIGYTIGNYLLKGLSFFVIPIFTRLLSTEDYGIYNVFLSYANVAFVLIGIAIHNSYKRAFYTFNTSNEKEDYYSYVSTTMLIIIFITVVFLLISNIFTGFIYNVLKIDRLSINLVILCGFGNAIICCFNSDSSLNYDYIKYIKIAGVNAVSNVLLSIILIYTVFNQKRYMGRILGSVIPIMLISFFIIIYFFKRHKPKNIKEYVVWGVSYSLPLVPHGLSQIILNQFDRIMILNMVSSGASGIYSFAYNIYAIVQVTGDSLGNVWETWFYELRNNNDFEEIRRNSSYFMVLMLIFSSIVIFISPELIKLFANNNYWESIYSVIPIVAAGYFSFIYTIPANVEYYHGKTKFIAIGTAIAAILNITLNYFFINKFGYISAAYTTLFTYLVYFLLHYFIAKKIEGFYLFSNKVVVMCVILMLITVTIGNLVINYFVIRAILVLIMIAVGFLYEEKNVGFLRKRLK